MLARTTTGRSPWATRVRISHVGWSSRGARQTRLRANAASPTSPILVGIVGLVLLAIGIGLRRTGARGLPSSTCRKGLHKEGHVTKARYRSRKFVALGVALGLVLITTAMSQAQTGTNIT